MPPLSAARHLQARSLFPPQTGVKADST
jgi:hypothetical protein